MRPELMRLVVDTNIFVSILIKPGTALSALTDYIDKRGTILYSVDTLTELVDVLHRRKFGKYTRPEDIAAFVQWVITTGELVAVDEAVTASRDSKDDKFLSLAVAGQADYLISGDKDLLVLGQIRTIPIVSTAAFLASVNH